MIDMAIVRADSSRDTLHSLLDEATLKTGRWLTARDLTKAMIVERQNVATVTVVEQDEVIFCP